MGGQAPLVTTCAHVLHEKDLSDLHAVLSAEEALPDSPARVDRGHGDSTVRPGNVLANRRDASHLAILLLVPPGHMGLGANYPRRQHTHGDPIRYLSDRNGVDHNASLLLQALGPGAKIPESNGAVTSQADAIIAAIKRALRSILCS